MTAPRPASTPFWTVSDLADYLAVPVATIYKWRHAGDGPRGYRIGKHVRYDKEDVAIWLATRRDDRLNRR